MRAGLAEVHRRPRHAVLFALTAGLLLGPVSRPATLAAATTAALLVLAARAAAVADAAVVHGALAVRPRRAGVALLAAAAVLAGALIAEARLAAGADGRLPAMHGRTLASRVVLLEPVRDRAGGPAVARARLLDGVAAGEIAVLRMGAAVHPGVWPGIGEVVAVEGAVAPLGPYDAYQRRRGAQAALDVGGLRVTGARRGGPAGVVDAARRRAEAGLARGLDPPDAALLRGMVLGQDERLSESVREDFERSGLAHVLAVSGQNVMLLALLVLAAGAVVGAGLRARLLAALALVAVYVPLTGAGPSIQRAGVMGAAGLVAALAGRPAHRWYALGLAAAVTLAVNPLAAGEPGWQLSFAAVAALLAIAPGLRRALARAVPGPVADAAAITTAATIGTAPLMALHFGQVSPAALPANLLAAAAIAPVMWLGMLAAAAAQVAPVLATPLNVLNEPLLGFVQWVAHTMAAAPGAVLPVRIGSPLALAGAYAMLAAAVLAVRAAARRRRPAVPWAGEHPWPRPRARRAAVLAVAAPVALVLLVAALDRRALDAPRPGELVVSFLNVGQGDATLLRRDGAAVLVDTGPPDGPILERLAEAGVQRLDALVLTHAQTDHEGAALAILRAIPTRLVVNGGAGWPSAVQRGLPATRVRAVAAHAGTTLVLGGIALRVLWPPPPRPGLRPEGDPNDHALVALASAGGFDVLLPADAESDVTARIPFPDVDALKVAHHGSDDPGLPALLERTRPEFAAVEVGAENPYGHPTASTLAALRAVGHVFRTDRDGSVHLRHAAGRVTVERSP